MGFEGPVVPSEVRYDWIPRESFEPLFEAQHGYSMMVNLREEGVNER